MRVKAFSAFLAVVVCTLGVQNISAQTSARTPITSAADLPRFSYPVQGDVQHLLQDDAAFAQLAAAASKDIGALLADYDIQDHAALIKLLEAQINLGVLSGKNDAQALKIIAQVRALEDKPFARLMADLPQEAFLEARMAHGAVASECPNGFGDIFSKKVDALPWPVVASAAKNESGFASLASVSVYAGFADSDLQPEVAKSHALDLAGAMEIIDTRASIAVMLGCKTQIQSTLQAYVKRNDVVKPDIWRDREVVFTAQDKLTPVNVAIWDSGIDSSLFPGLMYSDRSVKTVDAHGIAFDLYNKPTQGDLAPLSAQEQNAYNAAVPDMNAIGDLQGDIDSADAEAFKAKVSKMSPQQLHQFRDSMEYFSGYAHGTHVTGIAARGNPAIRLSYVRVTYDNHNPHLAPTEALVQANAKTYAVAIDWFKAHHVRVVNMSWWDKPDNVEKDLADNGIGKTPAERKALAQHYFKIERDAMFAAFQSAPDILFVTIAGNSNEDNAYHDIIPSSFKLPNLIVAGAVDQAGGETGFTSYGSNVLVDADGQSVVSVVPGGHKVKMSGTSMAAPQVTNLAAKLLAVDPSLTPTQVIGLIRAGADASSDGRRHLINPKKSLELLRAGKIEAPAQANAP